VTPPDNNPSNFAKDSLASIVGTIVGGVGVIGLAGLWTGTISGPANPDFWQQIAPYSLFGLTLALLTVPQTRRVIFGLVQWLVGLRIMTRKQRDALRAQGKEAASQRPAARVSSVPGLYKHGRLTSIRLQSGVLRVRWTSNRAIVGNLRPGRAGGWDVLYEETGESLGWAASKESGMELLEAKALDEH
jgi:hypothetical protein